MEGYVAFLGLYRSIDINSFIQSYKTSNASNDWTVFVDYCKSFSIIVNRNLNNMTDKQLHWFNFWRKMCQEKHLQRQQEDGSCCQKVRFDYGRQNEKGHHTLINAR
jgi:hypothetical protein